MKKILMSLFISMITISSLEADSEVIAKDINWGKDVDRSIPNVPFGL